MENLQVDFIVGTDGAELFFIRRTHLLVSKT